MNKAKTTVRNIFRISMRSLDFPMHMKNFLKSGEMDSWSHAIRAYSVSVSIKERQDVAKAALNVIAFIANLDASIRKKLVEVPDLFASVADLCDEEVLLQDSKKMFGNIFQILDCFIQKASVLMEANWGGLLVRALDALDNPFNVIGWTNWLFSRSTPQIVKMSLKTAGLAEMIRKKHFRVTTGQEWRRDMLERIKRFKMKEDDDDDDEGNSWGDDDDSESEEEDDEENDDGDDYEEDDDEMDT
mmetsp:Transcript_14619/g.21787  ORF Transcript_14619/g.21787 Transcript_14619/m.21787 type:complete len:244 (+) Transcript_14619:426-1157(+)